MDSILHSTCFYFFFNDTATTEIYTLSLHDALPISSSKRLEPEFEMIATGKGFVGILDDDHPIQAHQNAAQEAVSIAKERDRKSTRLNSSHTVISYAVFCLKKKKKNHKNKSEIRNRK